MNKKYLLVSVVGFMLVGGMMLKTTVANAQTNIDPMQSLIQKIAQRFNLKESDVQTVFNEHHTERQQQRQAASEARLTQLVSEGKITESQKQLILKKQAELQTEHDQHRQEMENWAKQNSIDPQYLMFGGFGRGMGMRGDWK